MSSQNNNIVILRLTALWALAESGLGGWMHALKLPFTGIFVGGFAVVLISLIAHYSNRSFRQVWKATVLVLLIKFAVSPQSPFQAYIAVGFQGLIGALFYSLIAHRGLASLLFGIIAMLESAVQKLIFMTLIFGKSLWEALNSFFSAIAKDFALPGDTGFSFWLIALYVGLYLVWGIVLGIWITRLPVRMENDAVAIRQTATTVTSPEPAPQNKRSNKWIGLIGILLFVVLVLSYNSADSAGVAGKSMYIILRTLAVLLLLFYVINPLVQWLMKQWFSRSGGKRKAEMKAVMDLLPQMRSKIKPAYAIAKTRRKGLGRYFSFIYVLIILSLSNGNEAA